MNPGKINKIIALALFCIMLVVYLMTVSPTIPFWDSGEFVACSYIMGIPHPPGSPLLSLLGKVFSLLPLNDFRGNEGVQIAYRINLIDVLLGALTVMLTYLIIVRLIHKFRPYNGSLLDELVIMFSSAVTALLIGFSDEFWTNAVEIETYMPSIFISMTALWLALRWDERKDEPGAVKYLFLAAYIIGLGNGIHPLSLLILPTIFFIVLFAKPEWFNNQKLWIYSGIFLAGIGMIKFFGGLELLYLSMAVFAFIAPVILYRMYKNKHEIWRITFLGVVICFSLFVLGYSVYPTIAVRALKNPSINEGNPDNWERYKLYMAREQYGPGNMYTGIFERKAGFNYQFSFMYLRYLIQQFPKWGPSLKLTFENNRSADNPNAETPITKDVYLSVLLLTILLYGLYTHARSDWRRFSAVMLFFIVSSIGLILYLNMQNPQVRERPYFFLGSYHILMVWIGMGVYGLIIDMADWLREKGKLRLVTPVTVILFVLFGTLPPTAVSSNHIDPKFNNFQVHNRTGDWAPRDYGYNILVSCEPDAILFTNGDNDTFPLWYLQEVEGFRRDVRVVNLSLLNTSWYILQMKHEGVTLPIEYTDDYIENVLCGRDEDAIRTRLWPAEGREITASGITWTLLPFTRLNDELGLLRIQDKMVASIINWVKWERPIYFAVTVADENKLNLSDYLSMEGMVYRLGTTKAQPNEILVNIPVLDNNIFEKYQYHTLSDFDVYKPPNTVKLVTNYFIGFAQLTERYTVMGDAENAVRAAWGGIQKTPNDLPKRNIIYQMFYVNKLYNELSEFLEWEISQPVFIDGLEGSRNDLLRICMFLNNIGETEKADTVLQIEIGRSNLESFEQKYNFGARLLEFSLNEQAYNYFNSLVEEEPENIRYLEALAATMYSTGRYEEALTAADRILELNPDSEDAQQTKMILERLIQEKQNTGSPEVRQSEE